MIEERVWTLLVEAALRGGIVLALAWLVTGALRLRSAELRHALWGWALIALLLSPLAALAPRWSLAMLPGRAPVTAATEVVESSATARSVASVQPTPAPAPFTPARGLLGLWLAGVALFLIHDLRDARRLARVIRESRDAEPRILAGLRRAATGRARALPVLARVSDTLQVPLACGVSTPRVVLPAAASGWSPAVLRDVLVHELRHLERHDPLWLLVARTCRVLFWFHPLVWLAVHRLTVESERACDDAVLRAGAAPSGYAETLLQVASGPFRPAPAGAPAFARPRGLEARVADVLAPGRPLESLARPWGLVAGSMAAALIAVVLVVQPVPGRAERAPAATESPAAAESPSVAESPAATESPATPAPSAAPAPPEESATPAPEELADEEAAGDSRSRAVIVRNDPGAPVFIRDASVRKVLTSSGMALRFDRPAFTVTNRDPRRTITALRIALDLPTTRDRFWKGVRLEPGASAVIEVAPREWSCTIPVSPAGTLSLRVVGALFTDGRWGSDEPPPAPFSSKGYAPKARMAEEAKIEVFAGFPAEPSTPALFRNPPDAPVVIVEARTPPGVVRTDFGEDGVHLPAVMLENRSDRTVQSVRVRFKSDAESHAVSSFAVTIRPHERVVIRRRDYAIPGRPAGMSVQLLGARFTDGTTWGTLDSTIWSRDRWVFPLEP